MLVPSFPLVLKMRGLNHQLKQLQKPLLSDGAMLLLFPMYSSFLDIHSFSVRILMHRQDLHLFSPAAHFQAV